MATRTRTPTYRRVKHAFLFKSTNGNGVEKTFKVWAKVRPGRSTVTLTLEAIHAERSIKLNGKGNTSYCPMAICIYNHTESFPHKVEGHVDWQYTRVYVVTKVNKMGLPSECVCYEHDSSIARKQDEPGGQEKLLERLKKYGPIQVELRPFRIRSADGRKGKDRPKSGVRDPMNRKGANLRYAVMQGGAQPVAP